MTLSSFKTNNDQSFFQIGPIIKNYRNETRCRNSVGRSSVPSSKPTDETLDFGTSPGRSLLLQLEALERVARDRTIKSCGVITGSCLENSARKVHAQSRCKSKNCNLARSDIGKYANFGDRTPFHPPPTGQLRRRTPLSRYRVSSIR